jgi:3-dehydroquinate dehydratase
LSANCAGMIVGCGLNGYNLGVRQVLSFWRRH